MKNDSICWDCPHLSNHWDVHQSEFMPICMIDGKVIDTQIVECNYKPREVVD